MLPVIQVTTGVGISQDLSGFSVPLFSFDTIPSQQLDRLCDDSPPKPPKISFATTDQGSLHGPLNIKMARILFVRFASLLLGSEKFHRFVSHGNFFTDTLNLAENSSRSNGDTMLPCGDRNVCCTKTF